MYRLSFIRERQIRFQEIPIINDAYFCTIAYAQARRITTVNEKLIRHRANVKTSIEYKRAKNWRYAYEMLDMVREELERCGLYEEVKQSYINLAAARILFYILGITEEKFFFESYEYYQNVEKEKYRFLTYPAEYYHDPNVYRILYEMETQTAEEYLCARRREAEGTIRWLKQELYEKERHVRWLQKVKRWIFPMDHFPEGTRILVYGYGAPWTTAILRFPVPYERIRKGSRVALIGEGLVARYWFAQLLLSDYCEIVAWVADENELPPKLQAEILQTT